MKRAKRVGVVAVFMAAFALAATAAGGTVTLNDALLVVTAQASDTTAVGVVSRDNGPIASIELDVPSGYTLDVGQSVGAQIGAFIAQNAAGDLSQGALTAADPSAYADPTSQACDPQAHVAVWAMPLSGVGSTAVTLPWFVDAGASGGYVMHTCFPAAQFGGEAGASPITAVILGFAGGPLHAPTAPGTFTWDALVTPFGSDNATPNPANAIDFQAIVPLPSTLTMTSKYNRKTKFATVNGRLMLGGAPGAGYTIQFSAAKTKDGPPITDLGTATTNADGTFAYPVYLTRSEYISAVPEPVQSACTSTRTVGCFSTEYPAVVAQAHAVVPKPVKKKKKPKK